MSRFGDSTVWSSAAAILDFRYCRLPLCCSMKSITSQPLNSEVVEFIEEKFDFFLFCKDGPGFLSMIRQQTVIKTSENNNSMKT